MFSVLVAFALGQAAVSDEATAVDPDGAAVSAPVEAAAVAPGLEERATHKAFMDWQFDTLKDPDSAKWRPLKDEYETEVVLKKGILGKQTWRGKLACYRLNAKNSYGAYIGYQKIAVLVQPDGTAKVWEGREGVTELSEMMKYGYANKIIAQYC